ncbi:MAG: DUF3892 domain-containing protein [Bdellovibrionales bacterium]|nr:DUF3892 domain-containing protein [Bdellovibrionales bacterium]
MIRSGGTWTWRNNNPGNMRSGKFSKSNGCIGYSGGFAVFPTLDQGEVALRDLLKNGYKGSSIKSLIKHYAPKKDNNNPVKYLRFILTKIGIKDPKTMVRDLDSKQFENLVAAIKSHEGWKIGQTNLPLRITKVLKDRKKKMIVAYCIEKIGWLEKDKAVELSIRHEIDGVVARSSKGSLYIRTRHDVKVTNNLDVLG